MRQNLLPDNLLIHLVPAQRSNVEIGKTVNFIRAISEHFTVGLIALQYYSIHPHEHIAIPKAFVELAVF